MLRLNTMSLCGCLCSSSVAFLLVTQAAEQDKVLSCYPTSFLNHVRHGADGGRREKIIIKSYQQQQQLCSNFLCSRRSAEHVIQSSHHFLPVSEKARVKRVRNWLEVTGLANGRERCRALVCVHSACSEPC